VADRDSGSSLVWFLAGLGLGALAGVLYAPRAGSETREALLARAEEGREFVKGRAREVRDQVREQASGWADKGREVVGQKKEQFRTAYEAGRQAYHETTAETK